MPQQIHSLIVSLVLGTLLSMGSVQTVKANDASTRAEIFSAFGWDLDSTEISSQKIADGLYVLFGAGGNIAVSIGTQGVLMVDDQFPELVPKIEAVIRDLGGDNVDFVVNTHWHFDHADGNMGFGPKGVWLVSQANSRSMMLDPHNINLVGISYDQAAYPESALPVITFDDHMQFHFNGQKIDLLHFGAAHTTGDTAVIFRGSNAVHLGDVYNNSGYPFIDADNGGGVNGLIEFCQGVLDSINASTIVVPGHGPVSDYHGLKEYISIISQARDNILALMDKGSTLEEVIAAAPTAQWDDKMGDPVMFIDRAYTSLQKHNKTHH